MRSKAPDWNGLQAEHLQYAHPCLIVIISKLFNVMLASNLVPDGFGCGLSIPIPKVTNRTVTATVDDFRIITICPILSKVFELCLATSLTSVLKSSSRQFGFKKGTSCNQGTHVLKSTVDFFTSKNTNVSLGAIDLSKAFDKLNHHDLFTVLINKGNPVGIVNILLNWFSKTTTCVLWNSFLSAPVVLTAGLRQGGILSPSLFAVFIDGIFDFLEKTMLVCFVNGFCINTLMYADDLIIIALTISDLRTLLNCCSAFFDNIDLPINFASASTLVADTELSLTVSPCLGLQT